MIVLCVIIKRRLNYKKMEELIKTITEIKIVKVVSIKQIRCYFCEEFRGTAKRELIRQTILNKKTKKIIGISERLFWSAQGFKRIGSKLWLCEECNERKCERCGVLLNNKKICSSNACQIKHGDFYKNNPNYCKICWNIKQGRNK